MDNCKAYMEGYAEGDNIHPRKNPYPLESTEYEDWQEGFLDRLFSELGLAEAKL